MEIQSGLLRIDIECIIWTVWSISSGRKSIYGRLFLEKNPYMDRQSIYFWKKVHIWTVSQSISGRKSIGGGDWLPGGGGGRAAVPAAAAPAAVTSTAAAASQQLSTMGKVP